MHSIQHSSLEIPPGKIETQFMFFYNIGAQIQTITGTNTTSEQKPNSYFEERPIKGSELYKSAFFDNPIPTICALHLHGTCCLEKEINLEIKKLSER